MGDVATIENKTSGDLQVVKNFDDLLGGKSYALMGEHAILFENDKARFVIFRINPAGSYTKEDYAKLPEGAPFELLNGKLIHMPLPIDIHQNILGNIFLALGFFVKINKLGILRTAPLDVHFDKKKHSPTRPPFYIQ